jgi:SAM-dependent methyltransferase
LEVLNKSKGKSILEVGNVLSHYFPVNHDVVDKYEKVEGVINRDIIDFHPSKEYDLIISISTLEHVGWDENVSDHKILHDPSKILRAIENLRGLLAPQGNIVVTLPLGLNPELDRLLRNGKVQFTELFCLKRVSKDNAWIEVDWQEAQT